MITTSNTVVTLIIIIWFFTLIRSLIIMLGGNKLFDKAMKGGSTAFIPVINLFVMLDIGNVSTFLGILLFIPFVNLIILALMSYKIGKAFEKSTGFTLGLIFLPVIFYPTLFRSNLVYKYRDENYFLALDSARADNINLMSEEEVKDLSQTTKFKDEQVDSIFKSQLEMTEAAPSYRASRIDAETLNKMDNLDYDDNLFTPIERIEPTVNNMNNNPSSSPTFTSELNKEEKVEIVDL